MDLTYRPINGSQNNGLLIPNLEPPEISNEDTLCRTFLAEQHARLYIAAELCAPADAVKKATIDLTAVMKCFPAVTSKEVILAMAAWYTVLCSTDDAIERLDYEVAQLSLAHAVDILQNSSTDHPPATWEAIHKGAFQNTFAMRVSNLASAYCSHLQDLIPHTVQRKLRQVSIEALEAMASENRWRQRGLIDKSTYLSIRAKTIGIQPFAILVQHHFDPMSISSEPNQELESMKSNIAIALGLQNDLIGLERDIERGELFNYVLRLEVPSIDERKARALKAIDLHNDAIHKALNSWEYLHAGSDAGAQACAKSLLTFVEEHYSWATTSKRYQPHEPKPKPSRLRAGIGLVMLRVITAKESMRKGLRLHVQKPVVQKESAQKKGRVSLHGWTIRMELKEATKATG